MNQMKKKNHVKIICTKLIHVQKNHLFRYKRDVKVIKIIK